MLASEAPTATPAPPTPTPAPTPTPVPPKGREEQVLMPSTPYATPLHIIHSGVAGPTVMVVGGTHGDEPAGWMAAARVLALEPTRGTLLVIPNANKVADNLGVRTTAELGDLNRLYPGKADGLPMAQMALTIYNLVGEFQVDVFMDLHESYGFYKNRTFNSTAFLGQTISIFPTDRASELGQQIVEAVNRYIQHPLEEFSFREFPPRFSPTPDPTRPPVPTPTPTLDGFRGRASGSLATWYPSMIAFLVETGTQLPLERRVALHMQTVQEVLRSQGMLD